VGHPGIDPGHVAGTPHTPGDEAHHSPPARLGLAHQWAATVSCAGVLAHLSSSTDFAWAQAESVPTAWPLSLQGHLQPRVAMCTVNQGQVHLVLDELEAAINLILTPASHPTPHPGSVLELEVKLVSTGGETGSVHIRVVKVDVPVGVEDGDVIAKPASMELRVLEQPGDCVLLMVYCLRSIEAAGIIFAHTDLQQLIQLNILELVSSSDHFSGASTIVVAAVIGNDGTAPNEVIVAIKHKAGPGELSGRRLTMLKVRGRSVVLPGATLLDRVTHWSLTTSVEDLLQVLGLGGRNTGAAKD